MKKFIGAAVATAALLASTAAAHAATVWQSTWQGATFTLTQNSDTNMTFEITGVDALTGDWAGAQYLGAFSLGNLSPPNAQNYLTATQIGGSGSAASIEGGLNANGCNGSGKPFECFDFSPNISTAGVSALKFDINATSGKIAFVAKDGSNVPHLKIVWTNSATQDSALGDLYSQDIPFAPPTSAVPEPATWAMMITGFGLAGAAMRRRRGALAAA